MLCWEEDGHVRSLLGCRVRVLVRVCGLVCVGGAWWGGVALPRLFLRWAASVSVKTVAGLRYYTNTHPNSGHPPRGRSREKQSPRCGENCYPTPGPDGH